jgi:hypothetical protein
MKKILASIAFGCGLVVAAPLLAAPPAAPAAKDKPANEAGTDEQQTAWVQKLDDAAARITSAQKEVDRLLGAKRRGVARRYPLGEAKEQYIKDLESAQKELADAKRDLPALLEEARRAGVPVGILDRYENLAAETSVNEDDDQADAEPQDHGYTETGDQADPAPADKSYAGKKDKSYAAPKDDSAPPARNDDGEEEPE